MYDYSKKKNCNRTRYFAGEEGLIEGPLKKKIDVKLSFRFLPFSHLLLFLSIRNESHRPTGRSPASRHRAPVLRVGRGRQAHPANRQRLEAQGKFRFCLFQTFFSNILLFIFFSPPFSPLLSFVLSFSSLKTVSRSPTRHVATTTRGRRSTLRPPRGATRSPSGSWTRARRSTPSTGSGGRRSKKPSVGILARWRSS